MVVLRLSEHTDHVNIRSSYLKAVAFFAQICLSIGTNKEAVYLPRYATWNNLWP